MSSYGVIKNPQFVMVNFSLIESEAFTTLRGDALKLYLYMRRFVWRREDGPLGPYYCAGHLVVNGYLGTWGKKFGLSKATVSRLVEELAALGWLVWHHKSQRAGEPNVLGLGTWVEVGEQRIEVYFSDTLGEREVATVSPVQQTVSPVQQTVSPVQQTVSPVKRSNKESRIDNSNTGGAGENDNPDGDDDAFDALFGPSSEPPPRLAIPEGVDPATYLRERAARVHAGWGEGRAWGTGSAEFERYLNRAGVDRVALRALGERLEEVSGLHPVWHDGADVRRWCDGLQKLLAVTEGDVAIADAAYRKMHTDGLTVSSPHSLVEVARALRASRAAAPASRTAAAVTLTDEELAALVAAIG